jgi:hypothetical protein
MPAEGIHLTALREAALHARLPVAARACLARHEAEGRLGAIALDLPYFDHYLLEVVRYAVGRRPKPSALGAAVHDGAAIGIAFAVLDRARVYRDERLAALGLGLVSHIVMDRALHPLVNALARAHAGKLSHDAAHREVEKFQSILFHEGHLGGPIMGNARVVRLVSVPVPELLGDGALGPALAEAFTRATGMQVLLRTLTRMGRGYARHAILLGSPLGARVASAADKADAAPRFLHGAWGSFEDVVARAIDASAVPIARAWELATAEDAVAVSARARLAELMPPGTIDPQGHEVDLERPFAVPSCGAARQRSGS